MSAGGTWAEKLDAAAARLDSATMDAVIEVLESLCKEKYDAATACSIEAVEKGRYGVEAHRDAVSVHEGVCAALCAVYRLDIARRP